MGLSIWLSKFQFSLKENCFFFGFGGGVVWPWGGGSARSPPPPPHQRQNPVRGPAKYAAESVAADDIQRHMPSNPQHRAIAIASHPHAPPPPPLRAAL